MRTVILACAIVGLGAGSAFGQSVPAETKIDAPPKSSEATPAVPAADDDKKTRVTFAAGISHTFSADLKDLPGKVGVTRVGSELSVFGPMAQESRWSVGFEWESSFYRFENATGFAAGFNKPWRDTFSFELGAGLSGKCDEHWGWFVRGFGKSAGEDGAEFGDTLTGGGFGGASYTFNENLTVSLGLGARSRLDRGVQVLPIAGIEWKFAPQWALTSRQKPGLYVEFAPSKTVDLAFGAQYQSREYRLNTRDAAPGGVGRDDRFVIEAEAGWDVWKNLTIYATVGVAAWSEYRLDNNAETTLAKSKADPALSLSVSGKLVF
ncbi:MAG: hypothetical protein AABZ53_11065 [Planctomycetota bacterium]